jgi:hypothetical protein
VQGRQLRQQVRALLRRPERKGIGAIETET